MRGFFLGLLRGGFLETRRKGLAALLPEIFCAGKWQAFIGGIARSLSDVAARRQFAHSDFFGLVSNAHTRKKNAENFSAFSFCDFFRVVVYSMFSSFMRL